jgi:hypothetical protein
LGRGLHLSLLEVSLLLGFPQEVVSDKSERVF